MRKMLVEVSIKLIINIDDGIEISELIDELDYSFTSQTDGADIVDTEILDYKIVDSK